MGVQLRQRDRNPSLGRAGAGGEVSQSQGVFGTGAGHRAQHTTGLRAQPGIGAGLVHQDLQGRAQCCEGRRPGQRISHRTCPPGVRPGTVPIVHADRLDQDSCLRLVVVLPQRRRDGQGCGVGPPLWQQKSRPPTTGP